MMTSGSDQSEIQGAGSTRLESVEDIRRWISRERASTVKEEVRSQQPVSDTRNFRPIRRPSVAMLCIVDDNGETGEIVRVRQERLVVGRTEGDVVLPHDEGVSAKHFELYRTVDHGRWRWFIRDLKSTNGTFARVVSAELRHQQEILVGSHRFCLLIGSIDGTHEAEAAGSTRRWKPLTGGDVAQREVSLAEVTPNGLGDRYLLEYGETWIGSDPTKCGIAIDGDPFLSPQHAKLFCDGHRQWFIQNGPASANGTWLRIDKLPIEAGGVFQAGEQRFFIKIDEP